MLPVPDFSDQSAGAALVRKAVSQPRPEGLGPCSGDAARRRTPQQPSLLPPGPRRLPGPPSRARSRFASLLPLAQRRTHSRAKAEATGPGTRTQGSHLRPSALLSPSLDAAHSGNRAAFPAHRLPLVGLYRKCLLTRLNGKDALFSLLIDPASCPTWPLGQRGGARPDTAERTPIAPPPKKLKTQVRTRKQIQLLPK